MSETPSRPMKYPYTFTAKMAQFPIKYYVTNQWLWKYYIGGVALSLPVFWYIHKLANSPGNIKNAELAKQKEREAHHH